MNASFRYAYNQILRGMLNQNLALVVGEHIGLNYPTSWSSVETPWPGNYADFKMNWPATGVVRAYNYAVKRKIDRTDLDTVRRFLMHYDVYMERFSHARLF